VFADPGVIYVGEAKVCEGSNNGNVGDSCRTFSSWFYQQVYTVFGIFFSIAVHAVYFILEHQGYARVFR
jgi:hypothetical protein